MTSSYKRSLYSSIVRIVANVVMIGAVFLGMYMASRLPMSSMSTFCLWFFGISIPVWMGAFALIRKIRQVYADEGATYIEQPAALRPRRFGPGPEAEAAGLPEGRSSSRLPV